MCEVTMITWYRHKYTTDYYTVPLNPCQQTSQSLVALCALVRHKGLYGAGLLCGQSWIKPYDWAHGPFLITISPISI